MYEDVNCLKHGLVDLFAPVRVVEFLISQHIVIFHRLHDSFLTMSCMFIMLFL
jgi:hypothetical protein